ncbi:hypothetical protein QJS10_CPB21g01213 [Acorus calamus]|uniref:Uncharacterized protein n=1 Tax=Acorus calamus TaxID=4465 RepID=A0AAV9C7H5_ACOCL|nr:hypothetical protein QJS10_CPB21g01213 [Acorus calamus]
MIFTRLKNRSPLPLMLLRPPLLFLEEDRTDMKRTRRQMLKDAWSKIRVQKISFVQNMKAWTKRT